MPTTPPGGDKSASRHNGAGHPGFLTVTSRQRFALAKTSGMAADTLLGFAANPATAQLVADYLDPIDYSRPPGDITWERFSLRIQAAWPTVLYGRNPVVAAITTAMENALALAASGPTAPGGGI